MIVLLTIPLFLRKAFYNQVGVIDFWEEKIEKQDQIWKTPIIPGFKQPENFPLCPRHHRMPSLHFLSNSPPAMLKVRRKLKNCNLDKFFNTSLVFDILSLPI